MKKLYLLCVLSIISCSVPDSPNDLVHELKISDTNIYISKGDIKNLEITSGNHPYKFKLDNNNVSVLIEGNKISIKALMFGKSKLTLIDSKNIKTLINVSIKKSTSDYQSIRVVDQSTEVEVLENVTLEKDNVKRIKVLGSGLYSLVFNKELINIQEIPAKKGFYEIMAIKKGDTDIIVNDKVTGKSTKFKLTIEHFFNVKDGKLLGVNEGAIKNGVLVIPPNVREISGSLNNDEDILTKDQKEKLKELVFGDHNEDSEISIFRFAFKRCYNVEKITFGAKIKKIDIYMFIIDDDDDSRSLLKLKEVVVKKNHNEDLKWVEGTNWHYTFRNYNYKGKASCSVLADSEYFDINEAWDYFFKEPILLIKN